MASEAVQASCVMNGEAKNNQALKRKHLVSDENITARLPKELKIQDMYNDRDAFDDYNEDDSDWEPVQKCIEFMQWFCTNCTMVNLDDVVHYDICGEHNASGILRHGFYASPCSPEVDLIQVESEPSQIDKDLQLEASTSNCLTAVGFDEKMLLHSEFYTDLGSLDE
ncbi:Histone deacetylase 15 isoform 2 [Hibiscus syriacus]|uniref:Histone deacetylase 15 isoform 2 n=1 Tax=Hibiscus syriacus TaxID=106335 RepID=A0A6A3B6P1_HIBSY|nr:Histone deacetylase 15 isoform 2 [Hibiscus syriacus]